MLLVSVIILVYTAALLLLVLPKVEQTTRALEETNGKEVLNKVVVLSKNIQNNLKDFERNALQYHKTELRNLTDSFWSIVQSKYQQSLPENIGSLLREKGEDFKANLTRYYNRNRDTMSSAELKQAIIQYVKIYRFRKGTGYFFIHKGTTIIEHPIYPEYNGKDLSQLTDDNGMHFIQEFQNISTKYGSGTINYRWNHPNTKAIVDKVAYIFTFTPFDWIIGTTATITELQQTLKNDAISLANRIRYDGGNYFFINGYDSRVIAHPYMERGSDTSQIVDSTGAMIVPKLVAIARQNGQGFSRYRSSNGSGSKETSEKLTFSRDFPNWKMVISTESSIDDIQKEVWKRKQELIAQLSRIVRKTTIGKSGYLFIIDKQGTMIIHPNDYMVGRDTTQILDPSTGEHLFENLKNAAVTGKAFHFKWDKPTDKGNYIYDKSAWVQYVPELQWYITSSVYDQDLQETSLRLTQWILVIGLTVLLLSLLISFLFFRSLLKPIVTLSSLAGRVTRGDLSARSCHSSNDEIGLLALEFNTMVDTMEDNINNLDRNVAQKTKELEAQNHFFQTLFYESSDGMMLLQDGIFIDCNKAAYRMLRYSDKKHLLAHRPSDISPPFQPDGRDSLEKANEMIQTTLDHGSHRFEWVHLCGDGSETFFEIVLTRVVIQDDTLIHVIWRDINEKKAAEKKLRKTLTELNAILESIDYGVLFMDDQLRSRIINQACRELWQLPVDFVAQHPTMREMIEYNRFNNLYPVSEDTFDHYVDQRVAAVRQGAIPPTPFKRKDGKILQYQCVVLPDGWRMLTYFDITELKTTQTQLARAQKMEAIGMMAGGVAHDLNNILSGIVSYPELLLMQLPKSSELRKPLEAIQESGKRAATVVADLLTVARGVASTREPHDVNILIQEYLHSPECEKIQSLHPLVHCTEQLEATQATISCSPIHIKKTMMNLVTNGIEAIQTKGNLCVTTSNLRVHEASTKEVGVATGHYVVITVQDDGPGIKADDIEHIFEPFYTKKVMGRSGTGLGLSVVWNTVVDHEGYIQVQSDTSGTVFKLYFPVSSEAACSPDSAGPEIHNTETREQILVVDDEPQLRDIAKQILGNLGYRVTTVSSGEEAIAHVRHRPVDLLVIDMLMEPGINGRQTYEEILTIYPHQKAIIASGFSESDEVKATLKRGAQGFIKKPYTVSQLGQAVQDALTS